MSPRLFLRVAATEARKRLAYRADFWIQAVVVLAAELGIAWFVWRAVFAESGRDEVAGFNRPGMVLYYVAAILVGKMVRGAEFQNDMAGDIYDGSLSRYVLYPVPYFGFKYAQAVGSLVPAAIQFVLFGAAFPLLLADANVRPSPAGIAMGLVSVAAGNLLYYVIAYPLQGVAFWADNVWSLSVAQRLLSNFLGGVMLPLSAFPGWSRPVLDALPFRHLFWEPANALLGRRDVSSWAQSLALALAWIVFFAGIGRLVFRRGALRYTGVGI